MRLEACGYSNLVTAENGREALEKMRECSSPASARRINCVNCPLALVTATRMAVSARSFDIGNIDQSLVHINPGDLALSASTPRASGG